MNFEEKVNENLTHVPVQTIKGLIEKAQQQDNSIHIILLDRLGEIDMVSLEADEHFEEGDGLNWTALLEEAQAHSTPYFEIMSIRSTSAGSSVLSSHFGQIDFQPAEYLSDEQLQGAFDAAVAERLRFYKEREAVFGESAWPKGPGASA